VPTYIDFGSAETHPLVDDWMDVRSGTPGFVAPEHHAGRQLDELSDVYSLGRVFWFLCAPGSKEKCMPRSFQGKKLPENMRQFFPMLRAMVQPKAKDRWDLSKCIAEFKRICTEIEKEQENKENDGNDSMDVDN
jgi:serine/threonine protein kinase